MPIIGGINLGNLTDYLFVFTDGSTDANWQGASKGDLGDVGVDGLVASLRTSGFVPYAGTIYTNAATLGAWEAIVTANPGQAFGLTDQVARIAELESDLSSAFAQINALPASPGFESLSSASLDGLNTQNGVSETFVINVTSGFSITSEILITGDPGDVYILRWDNDLVTPGYQGQVKFSSGGAIVPQGGLTPANFIHVAGDINSSGGGSNPPAPYPQGPRFDDGQGALIAGGSDWNGGGFFTGYWLTTGDPATGTTQPLSNGIFVGGWYSSTSKFSMTSGTSGVHITPNPATISAPSITLEKLVSVDNGATFVHAATPPGPDLVAPTNPQFRYVVTNNGNVTLTDVTLEDTVLGPVTTPTTTLAAGESFTVTVTGTLQAGEQCNAATVTGTFQAQTVASADTACYFGAQPSMSLQKLVSVDGGATFEPSPTPPGPTLHSPTNPQFEYVITNTGNVALTDVTLIDSSLGPIAVPTTTLTPGASVTVTATGTFAGGLQCNTATVTGTFAPVTVGAASAACYTGVTSGIALQKLVSVDNGATFQPAPTPPGPTLVPPTNPQFRYVITNTGSVTLTNVTLVDSSLGPITLPTTTLVPGGAVTATVTGAFAPGLHCNTATASAMSGSTVVTAAGSACYTGAAPGACTVVGFQEVCVDADIAITATVTPGTPLVACLTSPSINPFGTRTCEPTGIPCGFSTQVVLCVAVPVSFGAAATTVAVVQACSAAGTTTCLPLP